MFVCFVLNFLPFPIFFSSSIFILASFCKISSCCHFFPLLKPTNFLHSLIFLFLCIFSQTPLYLQSLISHSFFHCTYFCIYPLLPFPCFFSSSPPFSSVLVPFSTPPPSYSSFSPFPCSPFPVSCFYYSLQSISSLFHPVFPFLFPANTCTLFPFRLFISLLPNPFSLFPLSLISPFIYFHPSAPSPFPLLPFKPNCSPLLPLPSPIFPFPFSSLSPQTQSSLSLFFSLPSDPIFPFLASSNFTYLPAHPHPSLPLARESTHLIITLGSSHSTS